jgi:hypothetical protein
MQRIKCRPRKLPVAKYCLGVDLEFVVGAPEMDDVAASATSSSAMTSAILWKLTMNLHLGRGSTFCKAAGCQLTFNFTEVYGQFYARSISDPMARQFPKFPTAADSCLKLQDLKRLPCSKLRAKSWPGTCTRIAEVECASRVSATWLINLGRNRFSVECRCRSSGHHPRLRRAVRGVRQCRHRRACKVLLSQPSPLQPLAQRRSPGEEARRTG